MVTLKGEPPPDEKDTQPLKVARTQSEKKKLAAFVCMTCRKMKVRLRLPFLLPFLLIWLAFAPYILWTNDKTPSPPLLPPPRASFSFPLLFNSRHTLSPPPPQQRLCDRHFPCGRCFKLGIQCKPPPGYLEELSAIAAAAGAIVSRTSSSSSFSSTASLSSSFCSSDDEQHSPRSHQQQEEEGGGGGGDQQQQQPALTETLRLSDLSIRTGNPVG